MVPNLPLVTSSQFSLGLMAMRLDTKFHNPCTHLCKDMVSVTDGRKSKLTTVTPVQLRKVAGAKSQVMETFGSRLAAMICDLHYKLMRIYRLYFYFIYAAL